MAPAVRLREVTEADLPIFFEQQLDPEATRMAGFPAREREAFFAHWAKILADPANVIRAVVLGDEVAGNIVSFPHEGRAEVGYWLGKRYWGRGIATRALAGFLQVVRTRPLYASVARHNVGSIRVLEKCGFARVTEEGEAGADGDELHYRLDEGPVGKRSCGPRASAPRARPAGERRGSSA